MKIYPASGDIAHEGSYMEPKNMSIAFTDSGLLPFSYEPVSSPDVMENNVGRGSFAPAALRISSSGPIMPGSIYLLRAFHGHAGYPPDMGKRVEVGNRSGTINHEIIDISDAPRAEKMGLANRWRCARCFSTKLQGGTLILRPGRICDLRLAPLEMDDGELRVEVFAFRCWKNRCHLANIPFSGIIQASGHLE
jgi:hypothetical protein